MIGASEPRSGEREAADTPCDAAEIACGAVDVACDDDARVDFGDAEVERVTDGGGGSSTVRTENKFTEKIGPCKGFSNGVAGKRALGCWPRVATEQLSFLTRRTPSTGLKRWGPPQGLRPGESWW
jgi:hypothetical protein